VLNEESFDICSRYEVAPDEPFHENRAYNKTPVVSLEGDVKTGGSGAEVAGVLW
jgi:hypothetical protein